MMNGSDNDTFRTDSLARLPLDRELLASILDNLDEIVYVADLHTHEILFANRYLRNLFGVDPTGKPCWHLLHASDGSSCDICTGDRLLGTDGEPAGVVCREYRNPFNKKWYAAKAQAIIWPDGRYVRLEIARDITEHKQLETFLEEARRQARTRFDSRSRFVALVAHDLKSPFVSMLGMIRRILRKEEFSYEVHRRFLENIMTNGKRILAMIDNLLAMDRLEAGQIRPEFSHFDLAEMVTDVYASFEHLAGRKQLMLENAIPIGTEIYADRHLYFVVLNNLISNAVKFSFTGGRITASYDVSGDRPGLVVRDYGQGIKRNILENIFRQDVKTSTPGTGGEIGSGLGLLFCQQIMQAHGGDIQVASENGNGATVYVVLGPSCRFIAGGRQPQSANS